MLRRIVELYRASFTGLSKEIWLLALIMLINRSGTMVIPFLSLYLTADLNFTLPQTGWVMSAFGLGSMGGSYLGGRLTDKIGYFKVQLGSLLFGGFLFMSLILAESFLVVCGLVFVTSVVVEAFRPANFAAVAVYSTPDTRTRAVALIRMAINLGFAIGPAMGGILADSVGFHTLFIIDGVTCISAGILLQILMKPKTAAVETQQTATVSGNSEDIRSPYRDRWYLFFIVFVFLNAIAFFQIFSTEPVFFRDVFLLNPRAIGILMAINGLLIVVLEMPLIYILEKHLSPLRIVNIGTFLIGLAYILFNWLPVGWTTAVISTVVISVGEMMSLPFLSTIAMNRANDQNRGQYMAIFMMAYSLTHIIAPSLGMQIANNQGFAMLWNVIALLSVAACIGFFFMERHRVAKVQLANS